MVKIASLFEFFCEKMNLFEKFLQKILLSVIGFFAVIMGC